MASKSIQHLLTPLDFAKTDLSIMGNPLDKFPK